MRAQAVVTSGTNTGYTEEWFAHSSVFVRYSNQTRKTRFIFLPWQAFLQEPLERSVSGLVS